MGCSQSTQRTCSNGDDWGPVCASQITTNSDSIHSFGENIWRWPCMHLTGRSWPNVMHVKLRSIYISFEAFSHSWCCLHLSVMVWKRTWKMIDFRTVTLFALEVVTQKITKPFVQWKGSSLHIKSTPTHSWIVLFTLPQTGSITPLLGMWGQSHHTSQPHLCCTLTMCCFYQMPALTLKSPCLSAWQTAPLTLH